MSEKKNGNNRRCPGEKYDISPAICRARQRNRYPKCLLCQWHELDRDSVSDADPRIDSDIFRDIEIVGNVPGQVGEYVMRKVGAAAAQLLRAGRSMAGRVLVGHDPRPSSRSLARSFSEGVTQAGLDAASIGFVPQEVLSFMLATGEAAGGAFVTGGSRALEVNGVRLFDAEGRQMDLDSGLEKVGLISRRRGSGRSRKPGNRGFVDPLDDYRDCVQKFVPELRSCSAVVDAAGGVESRIITHVFKGLPIESAGVHFSSDDAEGLVGAEFPAETVRKDVRRAMKRNKAELGAAFDFVGDRIAFFDEQGAVLRQDAVSVVLARELLRRHGGGVILHDLRASAALRQAISNSGGKPVSCSTGRLAVAREMRKKDALYGTDVQGRHYFKGFYRSNSPVIALLLMCSVVSRSEKPLSELAADGDRYHHSGEIRIRTSTPEAARAAMDGVDREYQDADRDRTDGITVRFSRWWFNLRCLEDEPELRLNVEGRTADDERKGRKKVLRLVKQMANSAERAG